MQNNYLVNHDYGIFQMLLTMSFDVIGDNNLMAEMLIQGLKSLVNVD